MKCARVLAALSLAATGLLWTGSAQAQIKQPGAHPRYSVELEPHVVIDWGGPFGGPFDDEGFGLGLRATIPIVEQGPIKTINNSMGIGFGGDFVFYGGDCDRGWWGDRWRNDWRYDCSGTALYLPVVLQWNFWLTRTVSVFGEPGLAIRNTWIDWEYCDGGFCTDDDESDMDFVPFIFQAGGRFMLGDNVGIIVRIGWPYLSVGANFLL